MKKLTIILALFLFGCDNYENPVEVSVNKNYKYYRIVKINEWGDDCKYILQLLHSNTDQIDFASRFYFIADCNSYIVGEELFFVPIKITNDTQR